MQRLLLLTISIAVAATAQVEELPGASNPPVEAVPAGPAAVRAVLIDGINKDPEEIRSKDKNVTQFARYFRDTVGVQARDLSVLTQQGSFVGERTGTSDAETIRRVLTGLARQPFSGTTVVYFTGQANLVGDQLRLNIPGPDLTHSELAELIKAFGDAPVCVILDCPGAGHAAKALAGPNRVLVFAARSDQPTSTRFSDYFVPALEDTSTDVNGDGRISLVEAFQSAVQQIDALFRDQDLLKSETALLDDDGDGVPSQHPWGGGREGKDGERADHFYTDTWSMVYSVRQDSEPDALPAEAGAGHEDAEGAGAPAAQPSAGQSLEPEEGSA